MLTSRDSNQALLIVTDALDDLVAVRELRHALRREHPQDRVPIAAAAVRRGRELVDVRLGAVGARRGFRGLLAQRIGARSGRLGDGLRLGKPTLDAVSAARGVRRLGGTSAEQSLQGSQPDCGIDFGRGRGETRADRGARGCAGRRREHRDRPGQAERDEQYPRKMHAGSDRHVRRRSSQASHPEPRIP